MDLFFSPLFLHLNESFSMIASESVSGKRRWLIVSNKLFLYGLVLYLVFGPSACLLQAGYIYPFEIFTDNGSYNDSSDLNLYIEVSNPAAGQVDFTFYNQSLVNSCIAEIYFEDNQLLDLAGITTGPGTLFSLSAAPRNLPSSHTLDPLFVTTEELSFDSEPAPLQNGINLGEWVRITFDINGGIFAVVIDQLNTATIRIGAHVIALPDGSSESAINVPEPATICLLGLGALALLTKRSV